MKIRLFLLGLLVVLLFNFDFVYALDNDFIYFISMVERIIGAFIMITIVLIIWIIMAILLLKPEKKVVNINMGDRYKDVSVDELEKYGIDRNKFKKMIYQKFSDIHLALSNNDYEILKKNLTNDLYNYYVLELDKLENNKLKNVIKDYELLNFKIYDIYECYGLLHVDVYLNVRMLDYVIDIDNSKCIKDSVDEKMDFEFELSFIKKIDNNKFNTDYLLSKKVCINKMKLEK